MYREIRRRYTLRINNCSYIIFIIILVHVLLVYYPRILPIDTTYIYGVSKGFI